MANQQIAIIGLGRFGSSVAYTLYQMGHDVLALETDEEQRGRAKKPRAYGAEPGGAGRDGFEDRVDYFLPEGHRPKGAIVIVFQGKDDNGTQNPEHNAGSNDR